MFAIVFLIGLRLGVLGGVDGVPGLIVTSSRKRLCSGVLALLLGVAGAEVCVFDLRGGVVTKGYLFSMSSSR